MPSGGAWSGFRGAGSSFPECGGILDTGYFPKRMGLDQSLPFPSSFIADGAILDNAGIGTTPYADMGAYEYQP